MQPQTAAYPQQGTQQGATTYHHQQGQQQLIQASPGQTIIQTANVAQPGPQVVENYPAKAYLIMGGLQLSIGILLIILSIVALSISTWLSYIGHGFWGGFAFILTGAVGIRAGKSKTAISAFMVLCVIASLVAAVCLIISAIGARCEADDYCRDVNDLPDSGKTAGTCVATAMAILSGIMAMMSSALCCCYGLRGQTASTGWAVITQGSSAQYVATPGQAVAFTQGPHQPPTHTGVASTCAGQPIESAGQPMASAGQPMASAGQLMECAGQPIATARQPMASAGQPMASAGQPMTSTEQPMASAGKPMATARQPMESAAQPMASAAQPMASAGQPMASAGQPMASAAQPMASAGQPMASAGQPMTSAGQPMASAPLSYSSALPTYCEMFV